MQLVNSTFCITYYLQSETLNYLVVRDRLTNIQQCTQTNRYKNSFVLYALSHFQSHLYVCYVGLLVLHKCILLCLLIQPLAAKFTYMID